MVSADIYSWISFVVPGTVQKIQELVEGLERDEEWGAGDKARNWIAASLRFVKETQRQYPLYCDIIQPFFHGVLEVCHGLSAMIPAQKFRKQSPICQFMAQSAQQMMNLHPSPLPISQKEKVEEIGRSIFSSLGQQSGNEVYPID